MFTIVLSRDLLAMERGTRAPHSRPGKGKTVHAKTCLGASPLVEIRAV